VTASRPAVFLDRDGTIIHDAEYVGNPNDVRLLPGAAQAIARLNARGLPVIVVTNQSGIARGLLTQDDYEAVRRQLDELLAMEGARIDASYACPHHPDFTGPCECRKPATLLYRLAAAEHGIDLPRSTFVGDRWRDVAPALDLGGRAILISGPSTPADELPRARAEMEVVQSLEEAVDLLLGPRTTTNHPPAAGIRPSAGARAPRTSPS
jgi:D-glycero-D-manno-heptose 1,7-bisphosphate phosphatase